MTILIVVAVNAGLILAVRRGGTQRQVDLLRRAASAARNPWAKQEDELSELRKRVAQLEEDKADPSAPDG